MRNWKTDGGTITMLAPASGTVSGQPILIGDFFGVANETKAAGLLVGISPFGVFNNQPKTTGEAWGQGDRLFYDTSTSRLTGSSGAGRFLVGYSESAALSAATTATVIYNQGGR